jgi:hypothetical protein
MVGAISAACSGSRSREASAMRADGGIPMYQAAENICLPYKAAAVIS